MTFKKKIPIGKYMLVSKQISKTELTRRDKFCHEYVLNGQIATQAYISAGYKVKNENVAGVAAFRLLRDVRIRERISELQIAYTEKLTMKREHVLEEMSDLASFDTADLFDENGQLLHILEMRSSARKSVQEIELRIDENGTTIGKVKVGRDKSNNLDRIAKHYNIYEDHQAGQGNFTVIHVHPSDKNL